MFHFRTTGWATFLTLAALFCEQVPNACGQGAQHAVLVGVNRYENPKAMQQPNLACAERDATVLANVLLEGGGYSADNVRLMSTVTTDSLYARGENIRTELKRMMARCKEGDTALFYFGGYERQFPDSRDYFMCPANADPGDRSSMLALSEVYDALAKCPASLKLVVIDSCRVREKGLLQPPEGVATFFACSTRETANEDATTLKHGYFSYAVIEALRGKADANGDGKVTLTELERYVPRRVTEMAGKAKARQTPEMLGDTSRQLAVVTRARP